MQEFRENMEFERISAQLDELEKLPDLSTKSGDIKSILSKNGISRRDFMKWAAAMTASMALPASFIPLTARAAELAGRLPVVWLHMAECTLMASTILQ